MGLQASRKGVTEIGKRVRRNNRNIIDRALTDLEEEITHRQIDDAETDTYLDAIFDASEKMWSEALEAVALHEENEICRAMHTDDWMYDDFGHNC